MMLAKLVVKSTAGSADNLWLNYADSFPRFGIWGKPTTDQWFLYNSNTINLYPVGSYYTNGNTIRTRLQYNKTNGNYSGYAGCDLTQIVSGGTATTNLNWNNSINMGNYGSTLYGYCPSYKVVEVIILSGNPTPSEVSQVDYYWNCKYNLTNCPTPTPTNTGTPTNTPTQTQTQTGTPTNTPSGGLNKLWNTNTTIWENETGLWNTI
jgi:hypothetical protein